MIIIITSTFLYVYLSWFQNLLLLGLLWTYIKFLWIARFYSPSSPCDLCQNVYCINLGKEEKVAKIPLNKSLLQIFLLHFVNIFASLCNNPIKSALVTEMGDYEKENELYFKLPCKMKNNTNWTFLLAGTALEAFRYVISLNLQTAIKIDTASTLRMVKLSSKDKRDLPRHIEGGDIGRVGVFQHVY